MSVVVLGVNLLSLGSLDEHSTAIFLDLLAGELHGDLLRVGGLVLDDVGEGVGVGEHLVAVGEGVGDGVELLVVVFDPNFASLHFNECITK